MINPFELDKQRDIVFNAEPADQLERAAGAAGRPAECKVETRQPAELAARLLHLRDYTLEGLETALTEQGFELDHGMLHGIARKVIYYAKTPPATTWTSRCIRPKRTSAKCSSSLRSQTPRRP